MINRYMPINSDSLNKKIYELLKVRGYDPVGLDSDGEKTPVPENAEIFKFTFKKNGKDHGNVWITIDNLQKLVIYFDDNVSDSGDENTSGTDYTDSWMGFLKNLKNWALRHQLSFDLRNRNHLASDMAQRSHMKKEQKVNEGYHAMGKASSYNDNVPTVKIVLQHTRQIQEGEQRFRNIAKIYLENTQGERILAPTTRPGIAQIYARHLAEGGVPNDDRWNHIKSLCEEYTKMSGFVRAVRGNQFNESAQKVVEAGLNHYQSLRETLGKLRGQRGYNTYFESYTPALMETDGDETSLNELFVQETLDPRIESVMPILSKLSKSLGEMKEVSELAEWADELVEDTVDENAAVDKSKIPAAMRKEKGGDWKVTTKDLEKEKEKNISGKEGLAALQKRTDAISENDMLGSSGSDLERILARHPEAVEEFKRGGNLDYDLESDLWDYYFTKGDIKNYNADAGEFIAKRLEDELGLSEGLDSNQKRAGQLGPTEKVKNNNIGKLVGTNEGKNEPNWDEIEKAEEWLNQWVDADHSYDEIIDELESEGFSPETAEHVALNMGRIPGMNETLDSEKQGVAEAYDPTDEGDMWYRVDPDTNRMKQKMWTHAQSGQARSNGWADSKESALKKAGIIRSKFDNKKYVKNVNGKWVQVYPFGQQGISENQGQNPLIQIWGQASRSIKNRQVLQQLQGVASTMSNELNAAPDNEYAKLLQGWLKVILDAFVSNDVNKINDVIGQFQSSVGSQHAFVKMVLPKLKNAAQIVANSAQQGVAEGSLDQRIAHAKKNNPLQASVRQHEYGYTALVTDANTGKPSWFGGAVWQTPELAMGHAKAFVKGFPYLEQRYAQRFIDKNFDGIAKQGVAENDEPGYTKYEQMKDKIAGVLIKLYDQGKDAETIKQMGDRVALHLGYDPEDSIFQDAWMTSFTDASLDGDLDQAPEDDYTDRSMRRGEMGIAEGQKDLDSIKRLLGK